MSRTFWNKNGLEKLTELLNNAAYKNQLDEMKYDHLANLNQPNSKQYNLVYLPPMLSWDILLSSHNVLQLLYQGEFSDGKNE